MANNVVKVNTIAIANIANINGITDGNLAKLNGEEFVSAFGGITWSTDDTVPASGGGGKFGNVGAQGFTNGISKATYEHNGSSWSTTGSTSGEHDVGGGGGTQGAVGTEPLAMTLPLPKNMTVVLGQVQIIWFNHVHFAQAAAYSKLPKWSQVAHSTTQPFVT